jgi:hypothetical protein
MEPVTTGRPAYHPAPAQHQVGLADRRLVLEFKTTADFRKDHCETVRKVCREFDLRQTAVTAPAETVVPASWPRATWP